MKVKKITAAALSAAIIASAALMASCKPKNDANTLYVELNNAGFGVEWIDPLIEIFEDEHPGITVEKTYITKGSVQILDKIDSGSTNLDIVFIERSFKSREKAIKANDGNEYPVQYAELTDIYNAKVLGEDVLLKDKMRKESYDQITQTNAAGEEVQYAFPWMQSYNSIVVNKKVIPSGEWKSGAAFTKMPTTTDEFFAYMNALKAQHPEITPTIHSLPSTSYWDMVFALWTHQYYGTATMKKFLAEGYHPDYPDDEDLKFSADIMKNEGLLAALVVLERIVNPENGYSKADDQSLNFTQVQNKFLETSNKVLFNPNGLWLEREMSANYDPQELDIEFIRMPVVSALGEKLGIDDTTLSALIEWIDGGKQGNAPQIDSKKSVAAEDVIAAVTDARQMHVANSGFNALIPAYSTKIALAKEFLQLMATERGMEAMFKKCGSAAPFKYSAEKLDALKAAGKLSAFTYSGNKLASSGTFTYGKTNNFFTLNSLGLFSQMDSAAAFFAAPDKKDRKTAVALWDDYGSMMQAQWNTYLRKAGITR